MNDIILMLSTKMSNMLFLSVLMALVGISWGAVDFSHSFGSSTGTVTNGLSCLSIGGDNSSVVCSGTNANYVGYRDANRARLSSLDVQTRSFRPPCKSNNPCTAFIKTFTPTFMRNTFGEDRYIFQDEDYGFFQYTRIVSCTTEPCGYGSRCRQNSRRYQLIAWDPYMPEYGPLVDGFDVPDCCKCARLF